MNFMGQIAYDVKILKRQMSVTLEQDERHFPAAFYKLAELIMDNQRLSSMHQKIVQIYQNDQREINQEEKDVVKNNLRLRRLVPVRIWGSMQRVVGIYNIYNPKNYEVKKNQLIMQGRYLEAKSLDVRYEGLKKCIDPESDEKLSYDENFDLKADRIAIHDVVNFIEQEALEDKVDLSVDKISSQGKEKINAIMDQDDEDLLQVSFGELSKSVSKKTQVGLAINYVFQNKKVLDTFFYKSVFSRDSKLKITELSPKEIQELKSVISDVNRWFKKYFKLKTVLHAKNIKSYSKNKLTVKRNSSYW